MPTDRRRPGTDDGLNLARGIAAAIAIELVAGLVIGLLVVLACRW